MTIGRLLVAGALCAPLLLAGCSDDPQPKIAPPTSSPSSSAPTQEPEPEAWEEKSEDGAVAFAEHWFEVFSVAIRSGDSQLLRELSHQRCEACEAIADRIDSIRANGGFYQGGAWTVISTGTVVMDGKSSSMSVQLRYDRERFKESADSNVVVNPAGTVSYDMVMIWRDTRWAVRELEVLA